MTVRLRGQHSTTDKYTHSHFAHPFNHQETLSFCILAVVHNVAMKMGMQCSRTISRHIDFAIAGLMGTYGNSISRFMMAPMPFFIMATMLLSTMPVLIYISINSVWQFSLLPVLQVLVFFSLFKWQLCIRVWRDVYVPQYACGNQRAVSGVGSPLLPTTWALGIELRLLSLTASTSTGPSACRIWSSLFVLKHSPSQWDKMAFRCAFDRIFPVEH